jgi:hypothetical protein
MPSVRLSSPIGALNALMIPPCKGAPFILWILFVFCFAADSPSPLWHGNLSDPDDYLYLVQATDWLNGQDWFDRLQHRMNPPQGTPIHFSRLLSAFYAGFIFLLKPFFGTVSAGLITAIFTPPLYFALFLFSLYRLGQNMIGSHWGNMTAYVAFFSAPLLFQFKPGHLDHHGLEALLAIANFYCLMRLIQNPLGLYWAAAAGLGSAFALTIGLEILPIVCLFSLYVGVWAAIEGGAALRSGLIYGLSLFALSLGFLIVTRAPSSLLDIDVQAYSIVYVLLSGGIAVCFAGVWVAEDRSPILRCTIGVLLACLTGLGFLYCFPELLQGPYGGTDPRVAKLIFSVESEAWSICGHWAALTQFAMLASPIMAIGCTVFMLTRFTLRRQRWIWGMNGLLLLASVGLSAFYQSRFLSYAQSFAVLPLAAMISYDWTQARDASLIKYYMRIARLGLLLLIGPISLFMMTKGGEDIDVQGLRVPTTLEPGKDCDMHALAEVLNDKSRYGDRPRLIMNTLNEGTELLMRTPHTILAAPYHTNIGGNLDAWRFFNASDPEKARTIASQHNAELIVICSMQSQLYAYDMRDAGTTNAGGTPFVRQLITGHIPYWLRQIQSPSFGAFLLFEILPSPSIKKGPQP